MAGKGKTKGGQVVFWLMVGLIAIGFGGWGATNFGGGVSRIGSVGEVEITTEDYARALQQEVQRLSQQTGQQITMEQARAFGIDRVVLSQILGRAALDAEAQRIGLSVGDAEVAEQLRQLTAFQGIDGSFDRESYEFVLERNGLEPAEFEAQLREDVARSLLQQAVTGGVRVPDVYVDTLYGYARETRDATWAVLTPDDLAEPIPEPTDEELVAWHQEYPEAFTSPEARVVTYAWITPEMLAEEIESDEAMLRELYEERADEYRQPERRLVERLVFPTEEEAQAAADAIAAGEKTFDQVVGERGLTLADIDMGDVAREDLGEAADAVFALEEPGVAGPAPSPLGTALYRVNAILAPQETTFEEAREDLAAEVEADQARRRIDEMEGQIADLLASGATVEEVAEETPLELGTITLTADTTEGPAAYEAFRTEANAVVEGDYPEVRRLDDGGLFALRLDEVREPELRPIAEVRDQVAEAWRAAQVQEALLGQAEALADEIAGGVTFREAGLEPGTAEGVTRDGLVEGLPAAGVEAIFDMAPGEARAVPTEDGAAVVRLDAVTPADQASDEAAETKAAFAERSAAGMAEDMLAAFVRAVEGDMGIQLDQAAIEAVHAQLP